RRLAHAEADAQRAAQDQARRCHDAATGALLALKGDAERLLGAVDQSASAVTELKVGLARVREQQTAAHQAQARLEQSGAELGARRAGLERAIEEGMLREQTLREQAERARAELVELTERSRAHAAELAAGRAAYDARAAQLVEAEAERKALHRRHDATVAA